MRKLFLPCAVASVSIALLTSPGTADLIYTSGDWNASVGLGGQFISGSNEVSDPFTVTSGAFLTDADVLFMVYTGNSPSGLSWKIGTTRFGSQVASGTVSSFTSNTQVNTNSTWTTFHTSFLMAGSTFLSPGSYWLTLYAGKPDSGLAWLSQKDSPVDSYVWYGSGGYPAAPNAYHAYFTLNGDPAAVPEPASLTLAGIGLLGAFGYAWRRRRKPAVNLLHALTTATSDQGLPWRLRS